MERAVRCPVCKKSVEPRASNPSFPFCTPRCRLVDLGRWLGEEYRVPDRSTEGEERAPEPEDGSDHDR